MKKILTLLSLLSLLLIGAKKQPIELVEITIINKSGLEIAIQLKGNDREYTNFADQLKGELYYLTVPEGDKVTPAIKTFEIENNTYGMQLYYLSTYDPVYGFKCPVPAPNVLRAERNIRIVVLPCDEYPCGKAIGEPSMWKYLPYPLKDKTLLRILNPYWKTRLIY